MCGFVALLRDRAADPVGDLDCIGRLRDRMAARGPDGAGSWQSSAGDVTFGHRRLAIRDLSPSGSQPMVDLRTGSAIVFNGELYDLDDLRAQLPDGGASLRGRSDTEVLLRLYLEEGTACLAGLRGMYAFVIWDARREVLVAARDPYGIKPLYIGRTAGATWLASQTRVLCDVPGMDLAPEPAGHVGFFLWGHVPDPWTLYRGIRAVPPGHHLEIGREGAVTDRTHADPVAVLRAAAARPAAGGRSVADAVADAVAASVRAHQVADVPVGVFLSAGLDSATLGACAVADHPDLRTITLGFESFRGSDHDETPWAERLAAAWGTRHTTAWVARQDLAGSLDQLFADMDQPSIDGANTWLVSRCAAQGGLKVALSGLGGDELFGGYPSFADVPRAARSLRFLARHPRLGRLGRRALAPWIGWFASPKVAGIPEWAGRWAGAYMLRRALFLPHEIGGLMDRELAEEGWRRLDMVARLEATCAGLATDHARVCALEATWYMRHQLLRDADWAGMAHGVEIRVPLVDMALLAHLAPHLVGSAPPGKRDLARAAPQPLADALLERPKSGFRVPLRSWFLGAPGGGDDARGGLRGWARLVHARHAPGHLDAIGALPPPRSSA